MNTQSHEPVLPKVLVANRGEIALRIIRGLKESGRQAVAVYADQDLDASYVRAADEAFSLDGTTAADTYLDGDKILQVALRCGADAIHPGYGFLAENAQFASRVQEAGLVWVGPGPEAIALLGDKIRARQTALAAGVAPVPGTQAPLSSKDEVVDFINQWDYPVVLKAADGGGGRGIHVLKDATDLENFFSTWKPGASQFFIERYVEKARHIETQCARDTYGNFTVYSTRDCSVQRRHQKLIEEAPAPNLPAGIEEQLVANSRALFVASDYVGLGTCEFLLSDDGELYFLEVNPRLQVEHTVTEEVCGVDLVDEQMKIAAGEELTLGTQVRGHSIELRVTSEDPFNNLTPSLGVLRRASWPTGPGIRIDTGVVEGDAISPEFDSMVAKIIVTAPTRDQAISRALQAISETQIQGVATPLPLYEHILRHDQFRERAWTRWLESGVLDEFGAEKAPEAQAASALPEPAERRRIVVEIDGKRSEIVFPADIFGASTKRKAPQPLRSAREAKRLEAAGSDDALTAPSQAIVVQVPVGPGEQVRAGDVVIVLESMKMESYVCAPRDGRVESINVEVGANVSPGQVLATLEGKSDES